MAIQENSRTFEELGAHAEVPTPAFTVDVQRADQTVLIMLTGELDTVSAPRLLTAADEALADGPCDRLILSTEDLAFVDSAGLRALLAVRAACSGTDIRVHLVKTSPFFEHLLDITGLHVLFR